MATSPIKSRAFERSLGGPAQLREEKDPRANAPRRLFYKHLCQVSIQNDYYNQSASRCPGFSVRPTPATAALMASLGLLCKDEGTGFSVFYDWSRRQELADYLLRQQESDP